VKVRGVRIELGEIESLLASHAGIREAVVTVTGEAEQQKLSAYVVVNEGQAALSEGELRRYLRMKLPEHMVPASYWKVARLPRLPSGKINRGAVAASGAILLLDQAELRDPRNEVEANLAEIWRELLGLERVGMEQNFFELGGHSLLAMQVMARIRRSFAMELAVRSIFEAPTIAGLAMEVEKAQAMGLKARTPILQRHPPTVVANREALLAQLDNLSSTELQSLLLRVLDGKQPDIAGMFSEGSHNE
jgi:acyl carrier protein